MELEVCMVTKQDKIWALGNVIKAMRGRGNYLGIYETVMGDSIRRMGLEESPEAVKIEQGKYYDKVLTEIMHDLGNEAFPSLAEIDRRFDETGS